MFENMTRSGENGLNIRTNASLKWDRTNGACKGLAIGEWYKIGPVGEPAVPLDVRKLTWKAVDDVVKMASSGSAFERSGILYKWYKVYKFWQL